MKFKSAILYWTDAALLALFAALAATGGVLHWVLPPGSGGRAGRHPARRELLDLSRHEWGQVHFWVAAAMVTLIVVHLALHWGWIKTCTSRFFTHARREKARYAENAKSAKNAEEVKSNSYLCSLRSPRSVRSLRSPRTGIGLNRDRTDDPTGA